MQALTLINTLAIGSVLLSSPVFAVERHALLIGVSAYPGLKEDLQLVGPQNDVQLMRDLLKTQGFAEGNIHILAEQVAGAKAQPTRSHILGELAGMAERAGKGDFVYLQFGGHGSQQPTRAGKTPPEPDGLDEIFMPRDIGKWDGSNGSVQNAILDEELGKAITAIRNKGAFVWAVFDNCHSGYITRGGGGGGDGLRVRRLDPKALGIPQQAIDKAVSSAQKDAVTQRGGQAAPGGGLAAKSEGGGRDGRGGHVYFYAAQSDETTPEMRLPESHPERRSYGVFTYTLAQVISANPGISYRQAGERVLQLYAAKNMRSPTPLFEGSALDAPLFGQQAGDAVRQWPIAAKDGGFEIAAGAVQQFGEGALFKVFPNAAAREGAEIGYLKAQKVDVMRSRLLPLAHAGKPALSDAAMPRDAVARVTDPAISLALKVAAPANHPPGAAYDTAAKALDQLHKATLGVRIEWVKPGEAADLRLDYADEQLWLLPPDGAWVKVGAGKMASIRLNKPADELRGVIAASLQQIAKVINLTRLAGQSMAGPVGGKLDIHLTALRTNGKTEEISGAAVPTLITGDKLQLVVRNNHYKPVDITVLTTDSLYGISLLYPHTAGEANRVGTSDTLRIPGEGEEPIVINTDTTGRENIVVIAVEAEPQSAPVNLGFLEQPTLPQTRGTATAGDLANLFMDAGFGGERTRGVGRSAPLEKTAFRVFNWITQPGP